MDFWSWMIAVPLIAFGVVLVGGFLLFGLMTLPPVALVAFVLWLVFGDGDIGALVSSPWFWGPVAAVAVLLVVAVISADPPEEAGTAPRSARRASAAAAPTGTVARGRCPVCDRMVTLTPSRRRIKTHVTGGRRCAGMGQRPREDSGLVDGAESSLR
jgi:hypothetical protein